MPYIDYNNLPQFISANADEILASAKAFYESLVGRPLLDAQTESFLIEVLAFREHIARNDFNDGARKMLLDFSSGRLLDYIVALVAVSRLGQQYSKTTLQFMLGTAHTGVTIPALTQVQSEDGKVLFQTNVSTFVPVGTYTVDIPSSAVEPGVDANGYAIGGINNILDSVPYVLSVSNTDITAGGSDSESDESLIARTKLAPNAFTNAGSYGAYKYWALTAHPAIKDCKVVGPGDGVAGVLGGQVRLYVLVPGVVTPTAILDAVEATCSADLRRPLCDDVTAWSPDKIDYDIVIDLTLYRKADANATADDVGQRTNDYCQSRKNQMSQDITIDQLKAIAGRDISSVFKAAITINGTDADLVVGPTEYSYPGTITTNVIGFTNG